MTSANLLRRMVLVGALFDIGLLCLSFWFFGGAHGPEGPFFVINVLNAPVAPVLLEGLPLETSALKGIVAAFAVVALTGAVYGLLIGLAVVGWRRVRDRSVDRR